MSAALTLVHPFEEVRVEIVAEVQRATIKGTWQDLIDSGVRLDGRDKPAGSDVLRFELDDVEFKIHRRKQRNGSSWITGDWWSCSMEPAGRASFGDGGMTYDRARLDRREWFYKINRRHLTINRVVAAGQDRTLQEMLRRLKPATIRAV